MKHAAKWVVRIVIYKNRLQCSQERGPTRLLYDWGSLGSLFVPAATPRFFLERLWDNLYNFFERLWMRYSAASLVRSLTSLRYASTSYTPRIWLTLRISGEFFLLSKLSKTLLIIWWCKFPGVDLLRVHCRLLLRLQGSFDRGTWMVIKDTNE